MNSRWLWNSHQRHKFSRVEETRDILKFWVTKMAFPGVFQGFSRGIFHLGCHVVSSEYTQDWEQCRQNVPGVPRHCVVYTFHRSKPLNMHSTSFKTGKQMLYNFIWWWRWRIANYPAILATYWPLLTTLVNLAIVTIAKQCIFKFKFTIVN